MGGKSTAGSAAAVEGESGGRTGRIVLIDGSGGVACPLGPLRAGLAAAGIRIEVWEGVESAFGRLQQYPGTGTDLDAVLLGPDLPDPLALARKVHARDPRVHLIFLCGTGEEPGIRQQMARVSLIGRQWSVVDPAREGAIKRIRQAAAATRQRRNLRTTLDQFNARLASPPDVSRFRRMVVSERQLAHILRHAQDAILTLDDGGVIQTWNEGAEKMFRLTEGQAVGRRLWEVAGEDWQRETRGFFDALRTGNRLAHEDLFCGRIEGRPLYVSLSLAVVEDEDGGRIGICGIARDITARKRVEEAHQRLAAIVESSDDAIIGQTLEGIVTSWNRGARVLLGHDAGEMVGQPLTRLVPPGGPDLLPGLLGRLWEGQSMDPVETVWMGKDGARIDVQLMVSPVRDLQGRLVGASTIARDVTESRRQEEAQRQLNEKLAASNEALTQSNMELEQFAYVASHDLQAPLRHISGFVQLLRNAYRGKLDEKADGWIDRTVEGVERMQNLIRDLLTYSRVDSNSMPFRPVSLARTFEEALEVLGESVAELGAQVTCQELPTVAGKASQLAQLLQNLIGNGIKYHGEQAPRVHVSAGRQGREWVISVRDNGIGIEKEHHEQVFDIFRRLHTQREYAGTGIGLAVCRRIVRRHGGRIWIESESGSGTTVLFTLPADGVEQDG